MDINFHYYAAKTLALESGFSEEDAQTIANFSEYIDDFNWISYYDCKNLPNYIKDDSACDLYVWNPLTVNLNFNPAMTGFYHWSDYVYLATERAQQFTVSPFHFIPRRASSTSAIDKHERTTPALVGDGSIISDLLIEARTFLQAGGESRITTLMRMGMALHTFADTYAHQLFSGYKSWANDVVVSNVIDNSTGAVATDDFTAIENTDNGVIPAIGHAKASHTPDLTYVSFTMNYKRDENDSARSMVHTRSNTAEFIIASRHILNYLRSCRGAAPIADAAWEVLAEKLRTVFLIRYTGNTPAATFAANWNATFPNYNYSFNKNTIEASFYLKNQPTPSENAELNSPLGTNYSETFYQYNYIADKLLIKMYGAKPRSLWWN